MLKKKPQINNLLWLYEPLEEIPRFVIRKVFFLDAVYIGERLYLALVERDEPWNGLMVCTSREHHASLLSQFPQLASQEILAKWLYNTQSHPQFESVATKLVSLTAERDVRLGILPKPKKPKKAKKAGQAKKTPEKL